MTVLPFLVAMVYSAMLSRVDMREHRLPNLLVAHMTLLLAAAVVVTVPAPRMAHVTTVAVTALKYAAVHAVVFVASRGQFGMGDVKFSVPLGMLLGYYAPGLWLTSIMVSFAAAAVVSVILVATRRLSLRSRIPFGPYMAVSALAVSVTALVG